MKSRKTLLIVSFTMAMVLIVSAAHAQKKTTVHGDIVEITSYIKDGMMPTSPSKKEVVLENLKKGGVLAIIDKSNKVYIIAPNASDTAFVQTVRPYVGIHAFVKGSLYTRSGMRVIVFEDIGKSLK